jgi:hypothetical protein
MDLGARAQLAVTTLGGRRPFTEAELQPHPDLPAGSAADDRDWEYFLHRAGLDRD